MVRRWLACQDDPLARLMATQATAERMICRLPALPSPPDGVEESLYAPAPRFGGVRSTSPDEDPYSERTWEVSESLSRVALD